MTIKFIDNFADFAFSDLSTELTTQSGVNSIADGPRAGCKALYLDGTSDYALFSAAVGGATVRFALRFKLAALSAASALITFQESATLHGGVGVTATGYLFAFRQNTTNVLATATGTALSTGVWYQIEGKLVMGNTGSVEVRLNGNPTPEINAASVDTLNGGTGAIDSFRIGTVAAGNGAQGYYTDLAVWDEAGESPNGWIGDVRVDTLAVTGAGSSTQWTPSAGNNYECVDETNADGDTSYIETATNAHKDLFALSNLTHTPTAIHAVVVTAKARKTDAGSGSIKLTMKSSSTEAQGSSQALSDASYRRFIYPRGVDPATSAAWTISGVNALEAGVEAVI